VRLPEYGYHVTGYDNNSQMVSYANKRIIELGFKEKAKAVIGDMSSKQFKFKFDVAINAINSLGYLLENDDIVSHFCHISYSIRKSGIYILHLSCAWDHLKPDEKAEWISESDGIRIKTTWRVENQDYLKKTSHELCTMEIDDHGRYFYIEDHHELRLWFYEDLKALIIKSKKLKLEAIYSETLDQIPVDSHISGELGNLYFVLKNL
jgi:hypothetical protein